MSMDNNIVLGDTGYIDYDDDVVARRHLSLRLYSVKVTSYSINGSGLD